MTDPDSIPVAPTTTGQQVASPDEFMELLEFFEELEDFAECEHCGGDGGFDEPAAWSPTWISCQACKGSGQAVRTYKAAELHRPHCDKRWGKEQFECALPADHEGPCDDDIPF